MPLRYALLLAALAAPALVGAQTRVRPVAAGAEPDALAASLVDLRARTPESKAFSATDARRSALARRLLALDAAHPLAHEELALRALLEFDWRRQMARRQSDWDSTATRGMSGAANRARRRAQAHLAAALAADPDRAGAHRLALRLALVAGDSAGFARAAAAAVRARPGDPDLILAAARAALRAGDLAGAEAYVVWARAFLSPEDRRALDDPAPFLTPEEQAAVAADSAAAAARAWLARDPLRLTPHNERHLEHAARLIEADLLFGDPGRGVRGWTTARGRVYLHFGPPDDDVDWTASNHRARVFGAFQRWAYGGPDGFVLTFEDGFRSGDFDFASSSAGEDDVTRARGLFRTQRERYALRPPGGTIPLDVQASAFRGEGGRTDLVVAVDVPLARREGTPGAALDLALGAFLIDGEAATAAERRMHVAAAAPAALVRRDTLASWTGALALDAAPGPYTLDVEALQAATRRAGAVRADVALRAFGGDSLQVSDLLLASLIEEDEGAGEPGVVRRGGLAIRPSASAAFPATDPLYVYVEVYGLHVEGGRARYEVEAQLRPEDRAGALRRLSRRVLGRSARAGVAVRVAGERAAAGTRADDAQYVVLDAAGQPPGAYVLTLSLRDLTTGALTHASRSVTLH